MYLTRIPKGKLAELGFQIKECVHFSVRDIYRLSLGGAVVCLSFCE